MAKFIAHSPNGQAYQCDSIAEVKQVEGGFKFRKAKKRNPSAKGDEWIWERFERFKGLEAGIEQAKASRASAVLGRTFGESVESYLARSPSVKERYDAATAYLRSKGAISNPRKKRNGGCGCAGACGNPHCGPKKRNPSGKYSLNIYRPSGKSALKHPAVGTLAELRKDLKLSPIFYDYTAEVTKDGKVIERYTCGIAGWKLSKSNPSVWPWERVEQFGGRKAGVEAASAALTNLSLGRKHNESMEAYLKRDASARERFNAVVEYLQRKGAVRGSIAQRYTTRNPLIFMGSALALQKPSEDEKATVRAAINEQESKLSRGYSGDIKRDYYESCWKSYLKGGMTKAQVYEAIGYKSRNPDPRYVPAVLNPKKRNGMSKSHLAHEKEEEKIFASMLSRLPIGKTVQAGSHRVRKLSKGYAVIDGERLSMKDAAAKLHGR